jgi:uncharacterized damage-inducible protein DinB
VFADVALDISARIHYGLPRQDPMSISDTLLPEFDQEMATTRRVLERVPTDKGKWKPHEKSFSLGHLAQLVAWMPGWLTSMLTQTELDIGSSAGYSYEKTDDLVKLFDRNVREARAAIVAATDKDYKVDWSLKVRGRTAFTQSRWEAVRQTINHLVHHRGQLTVYLRLVDVAVPMIYGPTADEKMPGF